MCKCGLIQSVNLKQLHLVLHMVWVIQSDIWVIFLTYVFLMEFSQFVTDSLPGKEQGHGGDMPWRARGGSREKP